jgi:hypothetical protein
MLSNQSIGEEDRHLDLDLAATLVTSTVERSPTDLTFLSSQYSSCVCVLCIVYCVL